MGREWSGDVYTLSGWSVGDPIGPGSEFGQQFIKKTKENECFVTNEVFWRFPELKITRFEPQKWDLQSETGPGASGAQKNIKK